MENIKKRWRHMLPWTICTLAAIFYSYEYLLRISPGVMIPELMQTFHISATALGNLSAFYYYAYNPMQIPAGVLMDRFGPRRILTIAVGACAIGTAIFGSTDLLAVATLGRFLTGFGSAFAFVGVLKLASIWLPPDRFAMVSGLTTSLGMVGAIFGQIALSKLVQEVGWSQTIIYSAYFGCVLLPLTWWVVRDRREDYKGLVEDTETVHSLSELLRQLVRIFRSPQILINGVLGGLIYLPTMVFGELWGIQYMTVVHGLTRDGAAQAVSMVLLGWAVGGPLAGWLSDKIKRRRMPLIVGSFLAAIILFTVMYVEMPEWMVWLGLFLFGFTSSVEVIVFAVGRENCHPFLAGTAVAATNFILMMGGAVCQPLVGALLDCMWDGTLVDGVRIFTPAAYKLSMLVLPCGLIAAGCLGFLLKETYCKPKTEG